MPIPSLAVIVRGERVLLRPPRSSDARELREVRVANADHLKPWNPLPAPGTDPLALASIRADISRMRREWREDRAFAFLIAARGDSEPIIGFLRLSEIVRRPFQNAYLGYWIAADRQGTGLMTDAVRLVLRFAFQEAGLHRVQAAVIPRNTGSRRVLAKAGFREEGLALRYLEIAGRWEDHVLHAITSEDWARQREVP
jgi:ribosomal-protein-alanine N-acetyltransferase